MNRLSVLFLCLSISGCGSVSQLGTKPIASNTPSYQKDLARTPYVEFMGDDQIQGLTAYVNNPMWKCSTCVPGQLSAAVLAQVPEVIALHPDMVVILTGAYDLKVDFTDRDPELADNVLKMLAMFESANISTVICLIPQLDYTDSYYFNEGMVQLNESPVPDTVPYLFPWTEVGLTQDNEFSQTDLAAIEPHMYQEVQSFHLGGTK
jgi:hypothetical protein